MKELYERQARQNENLRKLADNGENPYTGGTEIWTGEP